MSIRFPNHFNGVECNVLPEKEDAIMVISTYGSHRKLTGIVKNIEKHSDELKFLYIKKTDPSLRNILIKSKVSALWHPFVIHLVKSHCARPAP